MKRTIALAALILFAMTGTAQAKADDPKDACKHGGFSQYVDPATGQPFTSQSPCVSFVAQGGTLVPVEEPPVAPVVTFSQWYVTSNITSVVARWQGAPSTSFTYEWMISPWGSQGVQAGETGTTGVGTLEIWVDNGSTVELFIDGVSAGTYITH
jgi:hypothetical protein